MKIMLAIVKKSMNDYRHNQKKKGKNEYNKKR